MRELIRIFSECRYYWNSRMKSFGIFWHCKWFRNANAQSYLARVYNIHEKMSFYGIQWLLNKQLFNVGWLSFYPRYITLHQTWDDFTLLCLKLVFLPYKPSSLSHRIQFVIKNFLSDKCKAWLNQYEFNAMNIAVLSIASLEKRFRPATLCNGWNSFLYQNLPFLELSYQYSNKTSIYIRLASSIRSLLARKAIMKKNEKKFRFRGNLLQMMDPWS